MSMRSRSLDRWAAVLQAATDEQYSQCTEDGKQPGACLKETLCSIGLCLFVGGDGIGCLRNDPLSKELLGGVQQLTDGRGIRPANCWCKLMSWLQTKLIRHPF